MNLLRSLAAVLFPRRCAGCCAVLADEEMSLCADCLRGLKRTEQAAHRGNNLEQLFRSFAYYEKEAIPGDKLVRGAAWAYYDKLTSLPEIIHTIKFKADPSLAEWVGRLAAEEMLRQNPLFFADVDMLLPVALHPIRLRERGFNQSAAIARGIASVTGLPVDEGHLERVVHTQQQSLKTLEERATLGRVFAVRQPGDLRGKHVMVVDDVATSGSTIKRVLEVLHPIRGCTYSVLVLGYALHLQKSPE